MFGINKQTGRPGRWIAAIVSIAGLSFALGSSEARAAGMLIADGGLGGVLEIKEQTVKVTINNGVAVTEVTQTFRNTENRQVEALYLFPVPKRASVANFSTTTAIVVGRSARLPGRLNSSAWIARSPSIITTLSLPSG